VGGVVLSPTVHGLMEWIGRAEHVIVRLLDGLGMNGGNRMPPGSFVRKHLKMRLNATCPSTTACALTTVATGGYPNRHAITGWFTHMPDVGLTATTLPFYERFTKQPLIHRGIAVQDVIGLPPLIPRMTRQALSVGPAEICDTTYNLWSRGGAPGAGYEQIPEAIDRVIEHVLQARGPTYTHLYLPEIDTICHRLGVMHDSVVPLVEDIDAQIERLWLEPCAPVGCAEAVEAIGEADVVILGPGSLFTSIIVNLLVPDIRDAVRSTPARLLHVANIRTQPGETTGLDLQGHLEALLGHLGGRHLDVTVLHDGPVDPQAVGEPLTGDGALRGIGQVVAADLVERDAAGNPGESHDPDRLAAVLREFLATAGVQR